MFKFILIFHTKSSSMNWRCCTKTSNLIFKEAVLASYQFTRRSDTNIWTLSKKAYFLLNWLCSRYVFLRLCQKPVFSIDNFLKRLQMFYHIWCVEMKNSPCQAGAWLLLHMLTHSYEWKLWGYSTNTLNSMNTVKHFHVKNQLAFYGKEWKIL